MSTPDGLWAELEAVRTALETADDADRPALLARRDELRAAAGEMNTAAREDELRRELADVERELEALLDRHIGTTGKKRNFVMGFVWGDHDSAKHLAELNRKMDEAGGRADLEARRLELRALLGLD